MVLFPHLLPDGDRAAASARRRRRLAAVFGVPALVLAAVFAFVLLGWGHLQAEWPPSRSSSASGAGHVGNFAFHLDSRPKLPPLPPSLAFPPPPPPPPPDSAHASPYSFDLAALADNASAGTADWMAAAPDDLPLTRLSLPGTHDTLTHRVGEAGADIYTWYRCQNSALAAQLTAGVRYLDVRARVQVQPETAAVIRGNSLPPWPLGIYHGDVYTGYEFAAVAHTVFAFLDAHPTETVVVRLKEEAVPINGSVSDRPGRPRPVLGQADPATSPPPASSSGAAFLDSFNHYRLKDPRTAPGFAAHLFRFGNEDDSSFSTPPDRIPTVGELRGKILLLQEFPYFFSEPPQQPGGGSGPAASFRPYYGIPWELSSALLQIEDDWQIADLAHLDGKWDAIRTNFQAAAGNATATGSRGPLFLSHLSASVGVTPIDAAAGPTNGSVVGINDRTGRWLVAGDDAAREAPAADDDTGASSAPDVQYTPVGVVMADFPGKRLIEAILRRNSFVKI